MRKAFHHWLRTRSETAHSETVPPCFHQAMLLRLLLFSFAAATNAFSLQFVSRTTRPSMTADEVSVDTDVTKAVSAVSDILKSSVKPKIDLEVAPYHAIAEVSSAASAGTARQMSMYSHVFSASSLARHRICHSTHTRTRRR